MFLRALVGLFIACGAHRITDHATFSVPRDDALVSKSTSTVHVGRKNISDKRASRSLRSKSPHPHREKYIFRRLSRSLRSKSRHPRRDKDVVSKFKNADAQSGELAQVVSAEFKSKHGAKDTEGALSPCFEYLPCDIKLRAVPLLGTVLPEVGPELKSLSMTCDCRSRGQAKLFRKCVFTRGNGKVLDMHMENEINDGNTSQFTMRPADGHSVVDFFSPLPNDDQIEEEKNTIQCEYVGFDAGRKKFDAAHKKKKTSDGLSEEEIETSDGQSEEGETTSDVEYDKWKRVEDAGPHPQDGKQADGSLLDLPGLAGLPGLPSLPKIPQIPQIPKIPKIPKIPASVPLIYIRVTFYGKFHNELVRTITIPKLMFFMVPTFI
eukprot:TRINITY_DN40464_c0_g1_i2.p1 TRINITY_DN40464_c0_g1~~TRINITY_DN40464_c0_g1_i2.p1  ORF type:complete len:378 (-),score=28.97 TRINITY_DN40464_c0_g1_i2:78-1211(-)